MIYFACIVVLVAMAATLSRCIYARTTYDRILAGNVFGTETVILVALLAHLHAEYYLLDVAMVYALINFVSTIAYMRFFKHKSLG
ncbi:MAG: pH regulation protein F [Alphaproteobacteria bacterium]|nr:pH regulation protein F [Alphaproteobacteria bacterium]